MKASPALLLCALAGFGAGRGHAAEPPVDADLLEFLGSIGEEDDWQEFLEQKPVKAAVDKGKDGPKAPAKPPAAPAPVASKEKSK